MSLQASDFFDLTSFAHGQIFADTQFVWEPLQRIQDYLRSSLLGRIEAEIPEGVFLIHPEQISIGRGTVVESGSYIKGPCIIGEHCTVRHGAYIRGDLITGNNCVIGHTTEVKNAIFLDGAHAAHFAYVGDSILGNKVNLGAGTKCANLRLDGNEIQVHFQEKRYRTGMRKFGAIFGDLSQTGCNAVTNPGTLLGPRVCCHPCLNVGGVILSGCLKAGIVPIVSTAQMEQS